MAVDPDGGHGSRGDTSSGESEGHRARGLPVRGLTSRYRSSIDERLSSDQPDETSRRRRLTMIHPSTMAGPNWFTGSYGATNPFQQTSSAFFRNTPFGGPQGGFGPGNNPFQTQQFGFGTYSTPMQNMINEVIRQTVPTTLASFGIPTGYQTSFGPSSMGFQFPTGPAQFGPQFQTSAWNAFTMNPDWQNQNWQNQSMVAEMIRQVTNQAIQNTLAQNPMLFSLYGNPMSNIGTNPQQQNLANTITQVCQQCCQMACQSIYQAVFTCVSECLNQTNSPFQQTNPNQTNWQQQNLWNYCLQVCQTAFQTTCQTICQAVATCVNECLSQQNRAQSTQFSMMQNNPFSTMQNNPFRTQTTPFNYSNVTSQYGATTGIPTGAGAF